MFVVSNWSFLSALMRRLTWGGIAWKEKNHTVKKMQKAKNQKTNGKLNETYIQHLLSQLALNGSKDISLAENLACDVIGLSIFIFNIFYRFKVVIADIRGAIGIRRHGFVRTWKKKMNMMLIDKSKAQ